MTSSGRTGWRVLVVDDEENLNWSLVNSLRKEGYVTEGALTGLAAQQRLTAEAFDCVVSDVKMPGLDGFELLQWLRQHRPRTRVVMMTAFGSPTARQEALRGGVIAYLEKPFDLQTLKDELRRMTAQAPLGNGQAPGQYGQATAQAEIEGYDPLEVVRVLNLARRDMALGVRVGGQSGVLRFLRGELVWAEAGALRGDEAFLRLCTPRNGQVQPEPWDGRSDRNVAQPLSRLIFMALSQREGRGGTGNLPPSTGGSATSVQYTSGAPTRMASASGAGSAVAGDSAAPPYAATPPPTGPMSLPPTQPLTDEQQRLVQRLAEALPQPCGVLILRQDGILLGQAWVGRAQVSAGSYTHLATALQASARATLLADMGVLEELRITTTNSVLVVRRVLRAERGGLVVAVLPLDVDSAAAATTLHAQSADLLDLFR